MTCITLLSNLDEESERQQEPGGGGRHCGERDPPPSSLGVSSLTGPPSHASWAPPLRKEKIYGSPPLSFEGEFWPAHRKSLGQGRLEILPPSLGSPHPASPPKPQRRIQSGGTPQNRRLPLPPPTPPNEKSRGRRVEGGRSFHPPSRMNTRQFKARIQERRRPPQGERGSPTPPLSLGGRVSLDASFGFLTYQLLMVG